VICRLNKGKQLTCREMRSPGTLIVSLGCRSFHLQFHKGKSQFCGKPSSVAAGIFKIMCFYPKRKNVIHITPDEKIRMLFQVEELVEP